MSLLSAHHLYRSYGPKVVLDDVSLTIEERDRIGLIGQNGAGKSTLLRILLGREDAEDGEIMRRRDALFGWVAQVPQLDPEMTVGEAALHGLDRTRDVQEALRTVEREMESADAEQLELLISQQAELTAELERLGGWTVEHLADAMMDALCVPPKTNRIGSCSVGEQRRLALCIGLLERPDLLMLDEPTNHLDVDAIEWLEGALADYPGALILVTHDRYFLDRVTNRLAEIDRAKLTVYDGNYSKYLEQKALRDSIEAKAERNRQRSIARELQWVRRTPMARTTKQKARVQRFDALVEDCPTAKSDDVVFRLPHPPRIGKTILELSGLTKSFGNKKLCDALDLILKKGDRLGIVGPNGAGKTTLIRMILGEIAPDAGKIQIGQNTKIVYADQGRSDLDVNNTVLEEVSGKSDQVFVGDRAVQVQTFLAQLLFDDAAQRTVIDALSGGERTRVSLAKALRHTGNLVILDEPTNDLDLATLRVLEEALTAYPGCALLISHDRYFLDRVATGILAFEGDGKVVLYEGSHHLYRERLKQAERPTIAPVKEKKKTRTARETKKKRTFEQEREFQGMEAEILETEASIETMEAELSDPETVKKQGKALPEKMRALQATRQRLEALYARWAELDELEGYG